MPPKLSITLFFATTQSHYVLRETTSFFPVKTTSDSCCCCECRAPTFYKNMPLSDMTVTMYKRFLFFAWLGWRCVCD